MQQIDFGQDLPLPVEATSEVSLALTLMHVAPDSTCEPVPRSSGTATLCGLQVQS